MSTPPDSNADTHPHQSTRTIVHVLRHGEVYNPKGILYGRLPGFHLSETGQAQARTVADSLAGHDITHVVASPLQRAQETAGPIAAAHGLSIAEDDKLIEAGNQFEGLRVAVGDGALSRPRSGTKRSASVTSCPCGPCVDSCRATVSGTTPGIVSAAWPR